MADIWVGIEQEGQFKGLKTLFVSVKNVMVREINEYLKKYNNIKQIYLGAGMCGPISNTVLRHCCLYHKKLIITCEVPFYKLHKIPSDLYKYINLIVTFDHLNIKDFKKFKNVQIKLQAINTELITNKNEDILYISNLNIFDNVDISTLKDKMYEGDVILR
jgi:hypothetical protein